MLRDDSGMYIVSMRQGAETMTGLSPSRLLANCSPRPHVRAAVIALVAKFRRGGEMSPQVLVIIRLTTSL